MVLNVCPSCSLSVVLPAFNEEDNIKDMVSHVILALRSLDLFKSEIIVVNDGSDDKTGEILDKLVSKHKSLLRVIHHDDNMGYADALNTGFMHSRYPFIFYTDSDRQFDVNELRYLLEEIGRYDIVCGYRAKRVDPLQRILIARIYNRITNFVFGLNLRDVDCAFKLFRKDVFDSVSIESKGFLVDLEVMSKAKKKGFAIAEVPVTHYKRPAGHSKVTPGAIFETVCGIIWLKRRLWAL